MDRAEQLRLLDFNAIDDAIARAPGRHGDHVLTVDNQPNEIDFA